MKRIAVLTSGGDDPGMNAASTPLDEVASNKKPLDMRLLEWARVLAR